MRHTQGLRVFNGFVKVELGLPGIGVSVEGFTATLAEPQRMNMLQLISQQEQLICIFGMMLLVLRNSGKVGIHRQGQRQEGTGSQQAGEEMMHAIESHNQYWYCVLLRHPQSLSKMVNYHYVEIYLSVIFVVWWTTSNEKRIR
jgi:hypothetical protein